VATRTITALFDSRADAEQAQSRLVAAGIPQNRVTIVAQDSASATGSIGSGSSGSGASGLTGSGAAGTGYGTSGTAGSGAEDGGFLAALRDLFLPDEDRSTYEEGLRRGAYLLTANVEDAQFDQALDIIEQAGPIDIDEREQQWRQSGWSGAQASTGSYGGQAGTFGSTAGSAATGGTGFGYGSTASGSGLEARADFAGAQGTSRAAGQEEVIPVAEERLRVGKREVNRGNVRVRSYVIETPVQEQVSLHQESVQVERSPVNRPISGTSGDVFQERTIDVTETSEEAVVAKEAVVTEELRVRRQGEERVETVQDTVRRTEVEVDDDRTAAGLEADRTGRRTGSAS